MAQVPLVQLEHRVLKVELQEHCNYLMVVQVDQ